MSTSASQQSVAISPASATVWLADIRDHLQTKTATGYAACLSYLTPDERRRYAGFIREQRRLEFLASRLLLRLALSRHLQIAADTIEVSVEVNAAPQLKLNNNAIDVPFFSLSHRNGIVACAVSQTSALGLDIEIHNPRRDLLAASCATFSPAEHAWLLTQSEANRTAAFYRLWNSKEALYKLQCVLQRRPSSLPEIPVHDGRWPAGGPPCFVFPSSRPDVFMAICSMQALASVTCIPAFSFHSGGDGSGIGRFFS